MRPARQRRPRKEDPSVEIHQEATINHNAGLGISETLERDLTNLTEIYKNLRWLEFTHIVNPTDRDLGDYRMLVEDLTATLTRLLHDLTTEQTAPDPAALAATDFPIPTAQPIPPHASPAASQPPPR